MSFDRPLLLLSLLALPAAAGVYRLAERRRMRYAVRFTNLEVLAAVAGGRSWRRYVPPAVFALALAALCVGLARPHAKTLVAKDSATVILVLDVSGSMQARDVQPTRLAAAQAALRTFLDRVPKQLRVGFMIFATDSEIGAAPTTDHEFVRRSVDAIDSDAMGGTAIGDALAAAVQLARQPVDAGATIALDPKSRARVPSASILFLSDGSQTTGFLQPLQGAARAKAAGIRVYTVSLGTAGGKLSFGPPFGVLGRAIAVPPDPETMKAIARATGGQFVAARSAKALETAYERLGSHLGRTAGRTEVTYAFLIVAAGLLVGAGVLSALWSPRLP